MGGVRTCALCGWAVTEVLQWGPPGMGGVSAYVEDGVAYAYTRLQWGPPGMGGVRLSNPLRISQKNGNFNGDLPEWEV